MAAFMRIPCGVLGNGIIRHLTQGLQECRESRFYKERTVLWCKGQYKKRVVVTLRLESAIGNGTNLLQLMADKLIAELAPSSESDENDLRLSKQSESLRSELLKSRKGLNFASMRHVLTKHRYNPDQRHHFGFAFEDRYYQWQGMVQGIETASAQFKEVQNRILGGLNHATYLDDSFYGESTKEEAYKERDEGDKRQRLFNFKPNEAKSSHSSRNTSNVLSFWRTQDKYVIPEEAITKILRHIDNGRHLKAAQCLEYYNSLLFVETHWGRDGWVWWRQWTCVQPPSMQRRQWNRRALTIFVVNAQLT